MEPWSGEHPNPWAAAGVKATSKLYLIKVLDVYRSGAARSVESICTQIAGSIGPSKVKFVSGPAKNQQRVLEKMPEKNGRFDQIRDCASGMFIVHDVTVFPIMLRKLATRPTKTGPSQQELFSPVRANNRLERECDATSDGGYRDYQLLVRDSEGWLVEIQVIPAKAYAIKKDTGTEQYTSFLFILAAAKQARAKQRSTAPRIRRPVLLPCKHCDNTESLFNNWTVAHDELIGAGKHSIHSSIFIPSGMDQFWPIPGAFFGDQQLHSILFHFTYSNSLPETICSITAESVHPKRTSILE